ncbi:hypothetical protein DEU38_101522 [Rhodococcus sp. AG1013]|uniref:hypothetical protein n=1 Tax=Rhodococcus sp. AG1013 TaxID=2183996 RepID=UPI000E2B2605|nr:hypothetical protein [Rhodococcus sp. AG1013]RDI36042.1 hypothetical protein DEU38_101522 [Rhodococcus sp. AG1013]
MTITRCVDLSAALWLEQRDEDWRRLAARGPRCFDKYARLRFIPDPGHPGQSANNVHAAPDALSDNEQLGVVLTQLARCTGTPDDCYFCIWDGWPSFHIDDPMPKVSIPNRDYFLFHGALADFAEWDVQIKTLLHDIEAPTPAFVWPADHAWCVTCDVDPHFASIGAGSDAIAQLVINPHVDVVVDDPDKDHGITAERRRFRSSSSSAGRSGRAPRQGGTTRRPLTRTSVRTRLAA